jgi:hypothetical protein
MADLDTVELSDMLGHFSERCALEIEIKRKCDYLRVIAALEKALIHNETLTTGSAFESWLLALSGLAVAPTEKVNGIAEATMIECEDSLGQFEDVGSLSLLFCS